LPDFGQEPQVRQPLDVTPEVDSPAEVISLTYYLDDQRLSKISRSAGAYTWDSHEAAPGAYTLRVTAVDALGNAGQASTPLTLAAPVVITAPLLPPEIPAGQVFTVQVDISSGQVAQVDLLLDDVLLDSKTSPTYTFPLDPTALPLASGTYTLTLRAQDRLGQVGQALLSYTILPDLTWLEQLGLFLGFSDQARFEWWLNIALIGSIIHAGVILAGLLFLPVLAFARRMRQAQLRRVRKRYTLDIANTGNTPSHFVLWAEDPAGRLRFQFVVDEAPLLRRSHLPPVEAALPAGEDDSQPLALPAPRPKTAPLVASRPSTARPDSQKLRAATGQVSRLSGPVTSLVGLLNTAARLLGPLGGPLRAVSSRLTAAKSVTGRVAQKPGQVMRQVSQLQRQAGQLAPALSPSFSSAAGGGEPEPVTARAAAAPSVPTQPRPLAPNERAAPTRRQQRATQKLYHTEADPAQTPLIEQGLKLAVAVWVTPADPYQSRAYPFTLYAYPLEQTPPSLRSEAGQAHISGLAGRRRYWLPLGVTGLALLLLAGLTLLAYWLAGVDVVSLLPR
jgi:hypothetical protein